MVDGCDMDRYNATSECDMYQLHHEMHGKPRHITQPNVIKHVKANKDTSRQKL